MIVVESFSIASGIVIALLCAIVQSLGLTLQRKSHLENVKRPAEQRRRDWQRPQWLTGFAVFTLSNTIGSVWQLGALPIVILAPLGGVSLVWNAIFARFILGDQFTRYLLFGTVLIAGGAVLVALFGTVDEPTHSLEQLLGLYSRPPFIAWIVLLCAAILCLLLTAHAFEIAAKRKARTEVEKRFSVYSRRRSRRWSTASETSRSFNSMCTGSALSSPTTGRFLRRAAAFDVDEPVKLTAGQDTLSDDERCRLLIGLAYGAASGMLSGFCLLFAKTSTEILIVSVVDHVNQFNHAQPWLILIVLAVAAMMQLWYLNRSLRLVGPTLICPTAFCLYNVSSILNGLFYYDQFSRLAWLHVGLVALGVIILLTGVWVVSLKTSDPTLLDNAAVLETAPLLVSVVSDESDASDDIVLGTDADREEEELEITDEETSRNRLVELFFTPDEQPRGFSIGIGAMSPGFAIRPRSRHHARTLSGSSLHVPPAVAAARRSLTSNLAGEPYVGFDDNVSAPALPDPKSTSFTFSALRDVPDSQRCGKEWRMRWRFWRRQPATISFVDHGESN